MGRQRLARWLFGTLLGKRLPVLEGTLAVPGLGQPVTIRRDAWGIPAIEAPDDASAWYGLGFCQGQDRSFQLETLLRVCRGTLAELAGRKALPVDRMSRRIGFARAAALALSRQDAETLEAFAAFARGVNDGRAYGCSRPAHEHALLRRAPTPWTAQDVMAVTKLVGFLLCTNWDTELARLRILAEDGPAALEALEPSYLAHHPASSPAGAEAGAALARLEAEIASLQETLACVGASNNWAIGGGHTRSGRPLLANDPHLDPSVPCQFYLARLQTPDWQAAGAAFVGTPGIAAGHNGTAAWGATNGVADQTDLFFEEIGADGASVREAGQMVPCEAIEEIIAVRGEEPVRERIVITARGPVIGPAVGEDRHVLSMSAAWLAPLPVRGFLAAVRCRDFESFRQCFAEWAGPSLNLVYADVSGAIGWQFVGRIPRRRRGWGLVPQPGWEPDAGWEPEPVPFEQLPHASGAAEAVFVTANNRPVPEGVGPYLGSEWTQGYRAARLFQALRSRDDWDVEATQVLQMDQASLPWAEARDRVLAVEASDAAARQALELLRAWDGIVSAGSPAAAVWELFVHEMAARAARAKAPRTWEWVLGRGRNRMNPFNKYVMRRLPHTVTLLREQPAGWFAAGWAPEMERALAAVVEQLRRERGPEPDGWAWGSVRPLTFRHAAGDTWPMNEVYNLGPIPWGGDTATVGMATSDPLAPASNPVVVAALRMSVDVGAWDRSRWALSSGQSGNPLSPHYDDQFRLWQSGAGVPIAWEAPAVEAAFRRCLRLVPG